MTDYNNGSLRLIASPTQICDWCTQIYENPLSLEELDSLAESGRALTLLELRR